MEEQELTCGIHQEYCVCLGQQTDVQVGMTGMGQVLIRIGEWTEISPLSVYCLLESWIILLAFLASWIHAMTLQTSSCLVTGCW